MILVFTLCKALIQLQEKEFVFNVHHLEDVKPTMQMN